MSESKFKCPCTVCFAVLLIVTGVKLLARELAGDKTSKEESRNV